MGRGLVLQTGVSQMKMFFLKFARDESGAVTVDWVVLTGGVLLFGVLVASSISNGATETAGSAGARLSEAQVPQIRWE
jgi:Flp pilus assembly pilin Flp